MGVLSGEARVASAYVTVRVFLQSRGGAMGVLSGEARVASAYVTVRVFLQSLAG
jgi:hypothetical protein